MAEGDVRCPYCSAVNRSETSRRTTSLDWSLLRIVHRRSETSHETRSIHINCVLCKAKYDLFEVTDTAWLRQHLSIQDVTLQAIKTAYSMKDVDLDTLLESVSVLTRPSRNFIHMFIELYGIRSFVGCAQKGENLIGVSFQVI